MVVMKGKIEQLLQCTLPIYSLFLPKQEH